MHLFLRWLSADSSVVGKRLFKQLLCWMALEMEQSRAMASASRDPLDVPALRSKRSLCRINQAFKSEVARSAAGGRVWRSGRWGLRALQRLKGLKDTPAEAHLERWEVAPLVAFLEAGRRVFRKPGGWCVSLATDATRLAGLDTLFNALYSPCFHQGMYGPPQVWTLAA